MFRFRTRQDWFSCQTVRILALSEKRTKLFHLFKHKTGSKPISNRSQFCSVCQTERSVFGRSLSHSYSIRHLTLPPLGFYKLTFSSVQIYIVVLNMFQDVRWSRKLYNECVDKSIFFELNYAPMIRDSTGIGSHPWGVATGANPIKLFTP